MTKKLKIEKEGVQEILIVCDSPMTRDRFFNQLKKGQKFMEKLI